MLSYFDLRKGVEFILDGEPYEVLDFQATGKAQDVFVAQTKIKNLINGKVTERTFHHGDVFQEAEISKIEIKLLYSHRDKFCFCELENSKDRFELTSEQIGKSSNFIKPNQALTGIVFEGKIINIVIPIKVQLKVTETSPGVKGNRAQAGTKVAVLETGVKVNVPLFIEIGDIIEVNTESSEYTKRVE